MPPLPAPAARWLERWTLDTGPCRLGADTLCPLLRALERAGTQCGHDDPPGYPDRGGPWGSGRRVPALRRLTFRCGRGRVAAFHTICDIVRRPVSVRRAPAEASDCVPAATHCKIMVGEMDVQHRDVLRLVCALRTLTGLQRLAFSTDAGQLLHGASVLALLRAVPPTVRRLSVRVRNLADCRGLEGPGRRRRPPHRVPDRIRCHSPRSPIFHHAHARGAASCSLATGSSGWSAS